MKYSVAALALLASCGAADHVRRQDTRLYSIPAQPTPIESTATGMLTILPVPPIYTPSSSGSAPVSTETESHSGSHSDSHSDTDTESHGPTTMGTIRPDPTETTSPAPAPTTGPSSSDAQTPGGSQTQPGSSNAPSQTSVKAAAPTAGVHNVAAGAVALAGLVFAL